MVQRILISSTSFADTPGLHLRELERSGFEAVFARGPLSAGELSKLALLHGGFDGVICGEDDFSASAIETFAPRLRAISKFGVGVDKIDAEACTRLGVKVLNTPGANHVSVAELTFGLLISMARRIPEHHQRTRVGEWVRSTGVELNKKTLGIIGFGRVGKAVAMRALGFGMRVVAYNSSWPAAQLAVIDELNRFASAVDLLEPGSRVEVVRNPEQLLRESDFISLHMNLTKDNRQFLNSARLECCKPGAFLVNVSRAALIDQDAVVRAVKTGKLGGYAADVVEPEPMTSESPLCNVPGVVVTPHIGSRTIESVQRQGVMALRNLISEFGGKALSSPAGNL